MLVTGGTGAFGSAVVDRLRRMGAEVVALARREPPKLPPGVRFVRGDVRDAETVEKAMAGCDAVAHLAWVVSVLLPPEESRAINLEGTRNVLHAMETTGCRRFVFSSSVTVYGSHADHPQPYTEDEPTIIDPRFLYAAHKVEIERVIADSGADAVVARVAPVLGRHVENSVSHVFTGPVVAGLKGTAMRFQLVHQSDVGRFLAEACLGGPAGVVNLAADDVVSLEKMGELLGRRVVHLRPSVARVLLRSMARFQLGELDPAAMDALQYMPVADTTRLRETFGFRCAWSTAETIVDMARTGSRYAYLGLRRLDLPWRLPYTDPSYGPDAPPLDGGELVPAGPPEHAGEFDSLIDPRFPEYTATNLSEAFPGPMTPLSLQVSADVMRASAEGVQRFVGMTGPVARELHARGVSIFGGRVYVNLTAARQMALGMPASSPEQFDNQFLGVPLPKGFKLKVGPRDALRAIPLVGRILPRTLGFGREVRRAVAEADRFYVHAEVLDAMSEERLVARLELLHDELCQVWTVACVGNVIASGAVGLVERSAGTGSATAVQRDLNALASARVLLGIERLAASARRDPHVAQTLRAMAPADALKEIRASSPEFAAAIDGLLAANGHRGPGETELENPTFSDAPELLIDAIAKAMLASGRRSESGRTGGRAAKLAARSMQLREQVRDAAMKMTHALRLAVRERGRRLTASGVLADPSDVFYLSFDELIDPPPDARRLVRRRRAERERLHMIRLPLFFNGRWEPETETPVPLRPGESLEGLAASPGIVRGRVRILRSAHESLQPGEILVAQVTDTGWTPLFSFVAAVVTDLGGMMSHAAVVAREYGVPSVVGTREATRRLADGRMVEVDGTTGVVRALD